VRPDDEISFTRFVEEHGTALLGYARLLFGGLHEAEDGLQAALLRVVRNWDNAVASPVGYTRTALRNLAVDGSRRRHLVPVPSDQEPRSIPAPDIADAYEAAGTLDAVLSRLPPRQRVTVVLRVLDGMTEAETAATLGCSAGTVKSNLSRGLAAMRDDLNRERAHERTIHE
jgi:RNA polymerase sigma-70 factor (sigma-E family)